MEIFSVLAIFWVLGGLVAVIARDPESVILWLLEAFCGLCMVIAWPVFIWRDNVEFNSLWNAVRGSIETGLGKAKLSSDS